MSRKRSGKWESTSWGQYHDLVGRAARALVALGVQPGDGVVILAGNRPEWFVTSLATATVGARTVGIYTNSTPEQCRYIAEHAEARLAVVDTPAALAKLEAGGRPPCLATIVVLDGEASSPGTLTWAGFLARGEESHAAEVARRRAALTGSTVTTLIYTSGTTGMPKGVILSHGNIVSNVTAVGHAFPFGDEECSLAFLPWAHSFGQVCELHTLVWTGCTIAINDTVSNLLPNLAEVKLLPSLVTGAQSTLSVTSLSISAHFSFAAAMSVTCNERASSIAALSSGQ